MAEVEDIKEYLQKNWFKNGVEIQKATKLLRKRFPDIKDLELRLYLYPKIVETITVKDLKNYICGK